MNESTIKKKTSKSKSNQSLVERVEFRYGVKRGGIENEPAKRDFASIGLVANGGMQA